MIIQRNEIKIYKTLYIVIHFNNNIDSTLILLFFYFIFTFVIALINKVDIEFTFVIGN